MHVPFTLTALALALTLGALGMAQAQDVGQLNPITVLGDTDGSPLIPSIQAERQRLSQVPGGTNLINPQQESRLATLKDALDYQPGLVVQEFFGGLDQPRLNIRGSGIQSNPVNRGVLLLQDGLPLNEADGSFVIGFLEPRNAKLISVRRGANALSSAATTLGGELDFLSLTGATDDLLRLEGGSFGRLGAQAAKGFQGDKLDGRLSLTHDRYDGYRHHAGSTRTSVQGNAGFTGDGFENRTYLSYVDLDVDIPFVVPRSMMADDPRAVIGDGSTAQHPLNVYKRDPHRTSRQFRFANRTYWGTEKLNQTFGLYAQNVDDTFQDPLSVTATDGMTWGAQWQIAGKVGALDYRAALDWARSDLDRKLYVVNPENGSRMSRFGNYDLQAENRNALLGFAWHVAPQWTVVGDAKFSQAIRDARERGSGNRLNQSWDYVSPTLGLVWRPDDSQRYFVNVSRSNEAPTYWEIVNASVTPRPNAQMPIPASTSLSRLKLQRADTVEIGGEGRWGSGPYAPHWAIALYHSDVKDELMSVSTANGTAAGTYNYHGGTRHRGVELGLRGSLPAFNDGTAFDYRLAYTFSDFRFKDGEYAGHRIAGVPRHLLSAEILYRSGGLRIGPNLRWMPAATETNHANTPGTQQDSYALLGFKVDYQLNKHWQAYVQGDNLTDKTYASAFVIRNTASAADPTFLPGNGRSVTAGVNYRF